MRFRRDAELDPTQVCDRGGGRIREKAEGVAPETRTQRSAERRQQHFLTGHRSGSVEACRAA